MKITRDESRQTMKQFAGKSYLVKVRKNLHLIKHVSAKNRLKQFHQIYSSTSRE